MTTDDLAWAQFRLRNCTNARRQLKICAECLSVAEDTLLARLGYDSLEDFRAAHPQNKRPLGRPTECICHPVPPEVMLESVLRYYGGENIRSVRALMGYTQPVTPEAIRHRVCTWKKNHPALAAGMPSRRPKPKKEKKPMNMNYDAAGLPAYAYAKSRYTNNIVRIVRGERTLFGVVEQEAVDTLNSAAGVSRAQAAAMYQGAMCGWDTPMADPRNYNEAGVYIGPEMEDKDGD